MLTPTETLSQRLSQISSIPRSESMQEFFQAYRTSKSLTPELFVEGARRFMLLVNGGPRAKLRSYGHPLLGLHYSNEFVLLWNRHHADLQIGAHKSLLIHPLIWQVKTLHSHFSLGYFGPNPAQALDTLIYGPTLIDCGIFCQLALWFGIRYVLGDRCFNQLFGQNWFFVTQLLYQGITDPCHPSTGNPLFSFLTRTSIAPILKIVHLYNVAHYLIKHPGGTSQGHNCLVIDDRYFIFEPQKELVQPVSKEAVESCLIEAFNAPIDMFDRIILTIYERFPEHHHDRFQQSYGDVRQLSEQYQHQTITEDALQHPLGPDVSLAFNFEQLISWVRIMADNTPQDSPDEMPVSALSEPQPPIFIEYCSSEYIQIARRSKVCFFKIDESYTVILSNTTSCDPGTTEKVPAV